MAAGRAQEALSGKSVFAYVYCEQFKRRGLLATWKSSFMRRRAVTHRDHRDHIDTETDTGDEGVKRRGHLKLRRACVFRCLEVQQTANALMKVVIP